MAVMAVWCVVCISMAEVRKKTDFNIKRGTMHVSNHYFVNDHFCNCSCKPGATIRH